MRFACSISRDLDPNRAIQSLLEPIDRSVTPGMVDIAFFYCTAHFDKDIEEVVDRIAQTFQSAVLIGCSAYGTIGDGREIERDPSMSLLVGCLPESARVYPFKLMQDDLDNASTIHDWERMVGVSPESNPIFIAMGDPFRPNIPSFVDRINHAYPGAPLFGGVASATNQPGKNMLVFNGEVLREGVVGLALAGIKVHGAVSQGCRPIGKPFIITSGEHNIVQQLGGKPPLGQLKSVLASLSPEDEVLAQESLLVGRVIDEYKETFQRGDFLIHNITGADRRTGAIAVAGPVKVGSTIQFHVRDAASADEDLREALAPYHDADVRAALVFSCNGRGTHMYAEPDHDVTVCQEVLGEIPTAGFFCGGEFGPIGGKNFIHGFTTSIALFTAE